MKEAQFYYKLKNKVVQCKLCPHFCTIKENELGKCRVRKNIAGKMYSLSYEQPVSIAIDSIEKKPLYHFLPKTNTFSIGMAGCNLRCLNCQNWQLSQYSAEELKIPEIRVEEIVKKALKSGCPSISYTYSEPFVSWEYVYETAKLARKAGLKNIVVTNGFINQEPLKELCRYIDAANIDLKSISEKFYKEICDARLEPILETLKILKEKKIWIEITNLIIPTLNDKESEIKKLAVWIKNNLGVNVPLHFSAFYPIYKLKNINPTPSKTLIKARKIALNSGLNFVYTGNIIDNEGSATFCPSCKKILILRKGFFVDENKVIKGKCAYCNEKIPGVWK